MDTEQIKYISEYNKKTYKSFLLRVRKDDVHIIEKLESVHNKNNYISSLIENDINPHILTIKQIKERIKPIMLEYNIYEVYLFGSYARGEATRNSDVDIYCSSGNVKTLVDEVKLIEKLEEALGKKVDLVTIGSEMQDYFKKQIEEDLIKLC